MLGLQGRSSWKLLLLSTVLGFSFSASASEPEAVPGEYLVKLKKGVLSSFSGTLSSSLGAEVVRSIPNTDIVVIRRDNMFETQGFVVDTLANNDMVELIEPNFIYRINTLPNDPSLDKLWGLRNFGQKDSSGKAGIAGIDVGAEAAWQITTGSKDVIVAVIDTGIDHTHPDLAPNMWTNDLELHGEAGVDDDGNGYVDDVYGWDFASDKPNGMDDNNHGSHCAGTIGAKGDDGAGIVGVTQNVRLMALKFLTASGGGSLEGAIKAIDYATKMGAHIQSNSWGGGGYSELLKEAIERAAAADSLFIAAAGNHRGNNDSRPTYPANYEVENVMSIAALDNKGQLASFSCYGKKTVHVAAPGVNVYSSVPGGYASYSGTSMAAPHVSGIAALLLAHEPDLTAVQIKERLIATSMPLETMSGKVVSNGLAHAANALTNTLPPPDANDPSNWETEVRSISSAHPYEENSSQRWEVEVAGATHIALHFSRFETEERHDRVNFYDANGKKIGEMTGSMDDSWSPVIPGSKVIVELITDRSVSAYGFDIDKVAFKTSADSAANLAQVH